MSLSPETRPTLLAGIRDPRNQVSWGEFIEIYEPLVCRYLRKHGLQEADAADVCQDVMQAVATAIRSFEYDPKRGSFRGWLLTVARSKLNNFFARSQRQPRGSGETAVHKLLEAQPGRQEEDEWESEFKRHLFHWAAERIRSEFQDSTWQAFWRVTVGEEAAKEVAASLGMSPGAVYIAKSRVLKRLTEKIQQVTT